MMYSLRVYMQGLCVRITLGRRGWEVHSYNFT